jgi:hypothetical protein
LLGNISIARADGVGLQPPVGDARGIIWVRGKSGLHRRTAVGRKLTVHIRVQLVDCHR